MKRPSSEPKVSISVTLSQTVAKTNPRDAPRARRTAIRRRRWAKLASTARSMAPITSHLRHHRDHRHEVAHVAQEPIQLEEHLGRKDRGDALERPVFLAQLVAGRERGRLDHD